MRLGGSSDNRLIKLAQEGDLAACELLLKRYQKRTESIIAHQVSDLSLISDLRQEVFIKIFNNIDSFRQQSSFYTWLYRVTRNTINNHFKVNATRIEMKQIDLVSVYDTPNNFNQFSDDASPESLFQTNQMLNCIVKAYEQLSDELKECVRLREFDGLSYEQIARKIHCPIGTVRSRIHRARLMMHAAVDKLS